MTTTEIQNFDGKRSMKKIFTIQCGQEVMSGLLTLVAVKIKDKNQQMSQSLYSHSSISAVFISTILDLPRFIILSDFPPL